MGGHGQTNRHPGRYHRITPALPPAADQRPVVARPLALRLVGFGCTDAVAIFSVFGPGPSNPKPTQVW
jgi:hypothetical protein